MCSFYFLHVRFLLSFCRFKALSANSALRGAVGATTSTADDKAVADKKVVANIGTNAEADPLSHAIRVLLYRYVYHLISNHSILTVLHLTLNNGELDLNCNTLGTLHTLEANQWRNK